MSENLNSSIKNIYIKKTLFQNSDLFKAFVGIHPQNVNNIQNLDSFDSFFSSNLDSIDGVGEIGLDPTYALPDDDAPHLENQKIVFNHMLTIAERSGKPISIHSRKSLKQILEILPSFEIKSAVFHWYDGSKKILKKINELGFFVSFGPYLLYSKDKQMLLKESDKNLLLLETDGPVNYRYCFNGVLTSPSLIVSLINFASNILKISFEDLTEIINDNSKHFIN